MNSRIKKLFLTVILLVSFGAASAYAEVNISPFGFGAVKPEKLSEVHRPSYTYSYEHTHIDTGYFFFDLFCEIVHALIVAGFEYTAIPFTFSAYPYSTEDHNFILPDDSGSSFKFFLSDAVVYNTSFGMGNITRIDGYFWRFFGPLFENYMYWDFNRPDVENYSSPVGIIYLGGQLTCLKFDYFIGQMAFQYGLNYGLYDTGLFKCSYIIKCYPGAHLEIEDRISAIGFDKWWGENELHFGIQAGRVQLFADWTFTFGTEKSQNYFHQWGGGAKIYL